MQFFYHPNPKEQLIITKDDYKYLFKIRRTKKDEIIFVRNLEDDYLYSYEIKEIKKKEAILQLINKEFKPNKPSKFLHLGWCIIDPKSIEKALPYLNEIGVSKITFFYCEYSQKNFKLNFERMKKILINSSMQCGRSNIIELEISTFNEFLKLNPIALDFNGKELECKEYKSPFIIGPEGGFSENEKKEFKKSIKLKGFILKSETAAVAISSKILL